jgi:hypothetical protein
MVVENVVRALVLDKIDEMREEIVKCCSDLVKIQSVNHYASQKFPDCARTTAETTAQFLSAEPSYIHTE